MSNRPNAAAIDPAKPGDDIRNARDDLRVKPISDVVRDDRLRATVYRLLCDGRLEAIKVGKRTLVLVSSVERLKRDAPRFKSRSAKN